MECYYNNMPYKVIRTNTGLRVITIAEAIALGWIKTK